MIVWDIGSEQSAKIWRERWAQKEGQISITDWENFRRDIFLMDGIEDGAHSFNTYFNRCLIEGVADELMADSGIGNPKGIRAGEVFYTATSLRHGRYIHSIRNNWPGAKNAKDLRVVEIGPGFGGLAAKFVDFFDVKEYVLIDSVPILNIARRFLAQKFVHDERFLFFETLPEDYVCDFVIATNCLGEMDDNSIQKFFDFIQKNLVPGGVFYSNNMLYSYPYDGQWNFVICNHWGPSLMEILAIREGNL